QMDVANQLQNILKDTPEVVDVDWMVEADQKEYKLMVDKEKAMLHGVTSEQSVHTVNMALSDNALTSLYDENAVNQVRLLLALDQKEKSTVNDIVQLKVRSNQGQMVIIGDLVDIEETTSAKSIYRKNQKRVVYVLADMAGKLESPVYAILGMSDKLKD